MPPRKRKPKKLTDRELINLYFDGKVAMTNIHNVMGCNELWYDKYYAITHTFKREDIDAIVSCIVQSFKGKSINIIIDKEAHIEGKTSSHICMLCNKKDGHDHGIMINEVY
jgi:hypothetical protein